RRTRSGVAQLVVLAVERARVHARHQVDDLNRLLETADQLPRLGERDAEHRVLWLVPAGAQPDLEAAVGDVIDGDRHLGHYLRVAKRVGRDQDAHTDLFCARREAGQQRPCLEVRAGRPARLDEVVAKPCAFEAQALEELPALDGLVPGHVLVGADAEAESPGHSPTSMSSNSSADPWPLES